MEIDKSDIQIKHEILTAISKKNYLYIRYSHTSRPDTFFWVGINNIDIQNNVLYVFGYNLQTKEAQDFSRPLSIDRIKEAKSVDETIYITEQSERLLNDIKTNPVKYQDFFGDNIENGKLLDYYQECIHLNNTPFIPDDKFNYIDKLDDELLKNGSYILNKNQFDEILSKLIKKNKDKNEKHRKNTIYLCMNILTIHNKVKGNYVLAYRKLSLNIKEGTLTPDEEITVCRKFKPDSNNQNNNNDQIITDYLDNGDLHLLDNFEDNLSTIVALVSSNLDYTCKVDTSPAIFPLQRNIIFNLKNEFSAIHKMKEEGTLTEPLKAFLGQLIKVPENKDNLPIVLLNDNANLKQLLAIQNAINNPISYIQGPPGTGKTSTIINTILTAFFNDQTVLFTSFNNKPIDGVIEKLKQITYKNNQPLFPFLVIKNNAETPEALRYVKSLYEIAITKQVQKDKLELKKEIEINKTKEITNLLEEYQKKVELDETSEILDKMLEKIDTMQFNLYLQDTETNQINAKRQTLNEVDCKSTVSLINENKLNFFMYIYFKTVEHLQLISTNEYSDFRDILYITDEDKQTRAFNDYLKIDDNIYKLLKVFPIVCTTCISAQKIATPKQFFDITIMDEASQCDNATALIPIIRGKKLMLVGDPQQLNPVIVMDSNDNEKLKQEYQIPEVYDFMNNSVYKTFIANDSISNEILLSYHYRCAPKIINFNNKKYYNNKLNIETKDKDNALEYIEVKDSTSLSRNTAPEEVNYIIKYISENKDKNIGIITPFRNQKQAIEEALKKNDIKFNNEKSNISCGTVHSFQGDEKDIIIFSLALTDKTSMGTYNWLKCNKELINVATSRGKEKLILICSKDDIERLHSQTENGDDIYELYKYVNSNGDSKIITPLNPETKALGLKAFSTETENEFYNSLNMALTNINFDHKIIVGHEVPLQSIFDEDLKKLTPDMQKYVFSARFDFVLFDASDKKHPPRQLLAFEIDGIEHQIDPIVMERDRKKEFLCQKHHFRLIRVPNNFARHYRLIKHILEDFVSH